MQRRNWTAIYDITANGFYTFRTSRNTYQLAMENNGVINYESLAQLTDSDINCLKNVITTDFKAINNDNNIILSSARSANALRNWLDSLYYYRKRCNKAFINN